MITVSRKTIILIVQTVHTVCTIQTVHTIYMHCMHCILCTYSTYKQCSTYVGTYVGRYGIKMFLHNYVSACINVHIGEYIDYICTSLNFLIF